MDHTSIPVPDQHANAGQLQDHKEVLRDRANDMLKQADEMARRLRC